MELLYENREGAAQQLEGGTLLGQELSCAAYPFKQLRDASHHAQFARTAAWQSVQNLAW